MPSDPTPRRSIVRVLSDYIPGPLQVAEWEAEQAIAALAEEGYVVCAPGEANDPDRPGTRVRLTHAGCWDPPDVPPEAIEAARAAASAAAARLTDSDESWQVYVAAKELADDLTEIANRTTVYYEDEDRPDGARPLYVVVAADGGTLP